jgi:hypothetical protein
MKIPENGGISSDTYFFSDDHNKTVGQTIYPKNAAARTKGGVQSALAVFFLAYLVSHLVF